MLYYTEFELWKSKLEKDNLTMFVKSSGQKKVQDKRVTYYYCNRSGYFASKSKGLRSLKTQGSSKLDGYCTASLHCTFLENGKLEILATKTHYGHQCKLGHIRIPEKDRLNIAKQLFMGVSFDNLLRDSVSTELNRVHLLTRKDLHNIERSFSLCQERRHAIDSVSVRFWVEKMKERKDNPVLFYKEQGNVVAEVGCNEGLGVDDFALVIQTPLQADVLRLGDKKVVCADATHGTNSYNFQLISVLVIDEFGEGFPAGFCLSNKEDYVVLANFFSHRKANTGQIDAKWFMSDMAEQYYNAWKSVYGGSPKKLLCTWHV